MNNSEYANFKAFFKNISSSTTYKYFLKNGWLACVYVPI